MRLREESSERKSEEKTMFIDWRLVDKRRSKGKATYRGPVGSVLGIKEIKRP